MEIVTTLEMIFTTEGGKSAVISIDQPKVPVNVAAVQAAMDTIIAQNVFTTSSGRLAGKKEVRLVERKVNSYAV